MTGKKVYTEKQIEKLCKMLITKTPTAVADFLGIPRTTVYNIRYKRSWRYISDKYSDQWLERRKRKAPQKK